MQIADVQYCKIVERFGQLARRNDIFPHRDALCVLLRAPIKPGELQRSSDHDRSGVPILDVKEIEPAAEYPLLMVRLNPQSLFGMQAPEAALQPIKNFVVHYVCN